MPEYIEREALDKALTAAAINDENKNCNTWSNAIGVLYNLPAADVEPKREPATWVRYSASMMECSRCGRHTARHRFEYCPHCGAPIHERKEAMQEGGSTKW